MPAFAARDEGGLVRHLRVQELHGHTLAHVHVLAGVDGAHATDREQIVEPVPVRNQRADELLGTPCDLGRVVFDDLRDPLAGLVALVGHAGPPSDFSLGPST